MCIGAGLATGPFAYLKLRSISPQEARLTVRNFDTSNDPPAASVGHGILPGFTERL